jgi:Galactoside-binding lectin
MSHFCFGRCSIDFINTPALNANQDIIFHIGIRARDKIIVRNHFQSGSWGLEERYGPCRVKKHETFEMIILAELQHYKIAVNGHHLGVFRHRLPLNFVQFVNVSGDVAIDHILLEQDTRSAHEQAILSQIHATPAIATAPPSFFQIPGQVHHVPGPAAPQIYYSHQPPPPVSMENFDKPEDSFS